MQQVRKIHPTCKPRIAHSRSESREALGIPDDAKVALWLGRLAPQKAPLDFLKTMQRLDGVTGLVVGDGPLRHEMESLRPVGVRMMGWMDDPGIALDAADLFVSTSRWEGLPIAAIEAATSNLPLVLSDCPGNRDLVVAGVPATLVTPGEPDAAAEAIRHLFLDRDRMRQLGERCHEIASVAYSKDVLRNDLLSVYRDLLPKAG
ncbi:MAG: glycosyltransferase family 4 protein [Actinomycetota bacterium]